MHHNGSLKIAGVPDAGESGFPDRRQLVRRHVPPCQEHNTAILMGGAELLQDHLADGLVPTVAVDQHEIAKPMRDHRFQHLVDTAGYWRDYPEKSVIGRVIESFERNSKQLIRTCTLILSLSRPSFVWVKAFTRPSDIITDKRS